jgi:hypothetical protein
LQVNGKISVSEGHFISDQVMYRLRKRFPDIKDVIIHIDPEDDETVHPCQSLPSRKELLAELQAIPATAELWPSIDDLMLHYNGGKLQLELRLTEIPTPEAIRAFQQACVHITCIEQVNFFTNIVR